MLTLDITAYYCSLWAEGTKDNRSTWALKRRWALSGHYFARGLQQLLVEMRFF
jgi:hypothetical protein